jgi:hypothetical protein
MDLQGGSWLVSRFEWLTNNQRRGCIPKELLAYRGGIPITLMVVVVLLFTKSRVEHGTHPVVYSLAL